MIKRNFVHKDYSAEITIDTGAKLFHGRIANIKDVVTFHGKSYDELEAAFKEAVDDYIETCEEIGEQPEKPYSGKFNVRLKPEVHRKLAVAAEAEGKSLNSWVADTLDRAASRATGL